jgi:enoyl-CoA hydratase
MVDYAMMAATCARFVSLFHCGKPVVCKAHGFCVRRHRHGAVLGPAGDRGRAKIGYPPARVWGSPTTSM